jgi:hypothetical protein
MYSVPGDTTSLVPGFPIRTSSDPRSVDSSPRHIAASHVLHRLPVPRHPPCALKHLHTKQFTSILGRIRNHIQQTKTHKPLSVRCSQPLSTNQTPHPTTKAGQQHANPHTGSDTTSGFPQSGRRDDGLVVSKPNSVSDDFPVHRSRATNTTFVVHQTPVHYRHEAIQRIAQLTEPPHDAGGSESRGAP